MWIFNVNARLLGTHTEELHLNISSSSPCGPGNCVGLQVLKDLQQCSVPKTSRLNSPHDGNFRHTGIKTVKNIHLAELVFHLCLFPVVSISARPSVSAAGFRAQTYKLVVVAVEKGAG